MREISVTITAGSGSEIHNHDLDFRSKLKHVHSSPNGVLELVEYKNYREKINEIMKPYIDEYNTRVEERYKAAWNRYNSGQIKTKPRKRDYKMMGYDYYTDHLNDTYHNQKTGKNEQIKMFRSLIIGLGDKEDRLKENITESQATMVFLNILEQFQRDFPDFHILGASIHLDEEGYYHMHLDYKPVREAEMLKGLQCTTSQDTCLSMLGYEPEQSIINATDKVPILFNAMRNQLYRKAETALNEQGLMMMYKATEQKEPGKDSSKNQRLEDWQSTQDAVQQLQHEKNVVLDIISKDEVTPEQVLKIQDNKKELQEKLRELKNVNRSRINKNNVVVEYSVLDQVDKLLDEIYNDYINLISMQQADYTALLDAEDRIDELQQDRNYLLSERSKFPPEKFIEQQKRIARLESDKKKMREFLEKHTMEGKTLLAHYNNQFEDIEKER